ncbi:MAG TPA: 3-ketoacyl-ACP reductase [Tepidisphaeraceae bacterium]|jgi:NAD(P)-dependent dehydrogenase (short-subunit alcohol dehydrogenase family)|nr:3-ketoacyl-ACP reductase [Tepidisphaeraceae bacterium]
MATATAKKVAMVTGGSRGIGFGIAMALAGSGFDLAINGRRDQTEVAEAIGKLQSAGAKVLYLRGDVADRAARAAMLEAVERGFGRLDVLVNNAGVAPETRADLLDASEESFDRLMSINLKGPYFLTQAAARWMVRQRNERGQDWRGCIINISSVSAAVASVNRGDYCISKAGIAMATQLWAARLAEFGIDVYEIRPGIVATDMTAGMREKYDRLIAGGLTVEKRWGTPEDVGRAAAVLARGEISYATGQVLNVDGGMTIRRL